VCTGITESAQITGSGKGPKGWFGLDHVNVSYDHPYNAQLDHSLNIDFVNEREGPSARVAVELSPESAKKLIEVVVSALLKGGVSRRELAVARFEPASVAG
jgi:Family of unknown function (DUF6295)